MFSPPFCRRSRSLAIGIEFESSFQQTTVEQYWATESLERIGCNVNASTVMYPYPKIESGQHRACSAPPRLWFDCRSSFPERRFFAEPHRPRSSVQYCKVHSNPQNSVTVTCNSAPLSPSHPLHAGRACALHPAQNDAR
jgi:hypothetical protein